jgi:plasmid maintenance system antidote protein VapI
LLLAHFGKESKMETVVPGITQEALAQMIGTTRSRVNHFMNKFKKLGRNCQMLWIGRLS